MNTPSANQTYLHKAIYALLFITLLCVVVYRAVHLTFTHDESLSYQIINGDEGLKGTANYHYLNTWLMNVCLHVFGDSEISLRLPNVLAFVVYLFFCYRILSPNPLFISVLIGAPLLCFNPYLLDFFSLARGYGLSLGFMLGSLYYCLKAEDSTTPFKSLMQHLFASMTLATLGLMANFNLLNFYLSLLAVFTFKLAHYWIVNKAFTRKSALTAALSLLVFCLPLVIAIKRLLLLKETNQLYYGSDAFDYSLYALTVCSFDFSRYMDGSPEAIVLTIKYVFALIGIYSLLFFRTCNKRLLHVFGVFSIIVIGLFLENRLFSALFPLNRTAIYLAPLFALLCYYFLLSVFGQLKFKFTAVLLNTVLLLLPAALTYNIVNRLHLNMVGDWYLEANTKDAIQLLLTAEEFRNPHKQKARLAVNWIFLPSANYYINTRQLPLEALRTDAPGGTAADYIYEFTDKVDSLNLKPLKLYSDTPTGLYKNQANAGTTD